LVRERLHQIAKITDKITDEIDMQRAKKARENVDF
jgi:hypothetical protein